VSTGATPRSVAAAAETATVNGGDTGDGGAATF
jgi:hypothetical protein